MISSPKLNKFLTRNTFSILRILEEFPETRKLVNAMSAVVDSDRERLLNDSEFRYFFDELLVYVYMGLANPKYSAKKTSKVKEPAYISTLRGKLADEIY